MSKGRITVLRKAAQQEAAAESAPLGPEARQVLACETFEHGQTFIIGSTDEPPEGFCAWAWADIHQDLVRILNGENGAAVVDRTAATIASCSDGVRPVLFRLERIE